MRHCGGLLRVLTSVGLDASLAVDPPDHAQNIANGVTQPSQPHGRAGSEAAMHGAGPSAVASQAADAAAGLAGVSRAAAGGQDRVAAAAGAGAGAVFAEGEAGAAVAATLTALHFPLQHYDRVKATLQSNRQLGDGSAGRL